MADNTICVPHGGVGVMLCMYTIWEMAPRPNYSTNVNKEYPYSELPFVGSNDLIRLPVENNDLIDHVNYWGEGKIVTEAGVSGFPNCYNVNHEHQLVSSGPDTGKKIPNRIPVASYTDCDTSGYIKGNSVKIVTVMGVPINKSCAEDMVRIVNTRYGTIVVFEFEKNSMNLTDLEKALESKSFLHSPDSVLPVQLRGQSLFKYYKIYLSADKLMDELYSLVVSRKFDAAVALSTRLLSSGKGSLIKETVANLLEHDVPSVMEYGYKLWISNAKEFVITNFPEVFKLIYNEERVTIIDKKFAKALMLDGSVDDDNDRLAWGDYNDRTSIRVGWKLLPVWDNEALYFNIRDIHRVMCLKMGVAADDIGDRKVYGSEDCETKRHQWSLVPVKTDGGILFYIINREYNQGLKLGLYVDSMGDNILWGNGNCVVGNIERYGWLIQSWK